MNNQSDWDQIWDQQMELSLRKWADEEFWYERTRSRGYGIKTSDYADQLLFRMDLSLDRSVLDIGCGDGAIAVRLAKKSKQVTALDSDSSLLLPLTQRVMAEGIGNLKFMNADLFQVRIGKDVEKHDIVLASRFRHMRPLSKFLEQMNTASRQLCYLTWIVERQDMDASICEILGREYYPLPDYSIICTVLRNMDIRPSIEIFEVTESVRFESESNAVEDAIRGYEIETEAAIDQVASLVKKNLKVRDGFWWQESIVKWALIHWNK